jgi:hypothetical protein
MSQQQQRATRRIVGSILAFAVYLFLIALAALVTGIHDAALARASLGVAVSSALLLLAGVVSLIAGVQLVEMSRRSTWPKGVRPPCKPPVVIAFLATFLIGVYLLLSTVKTASPQRPAVVAVALLLIAIALVALHRFGRDVKVTWAKVGTIALGLIGSTLAAWQLWYQTQYVPFHAGSDVSLAADLTLLAKETRYDTIRATVNYQDIGGSGVSVLGSTYTLTGSRVVRCHSSADVGIVDKMFNGFLPDPQRTRFMANAWELRPSAVLAAGKFVRDGKRLDPSVPASRTFVFFVPRRNYQLLRFRAQLLAVPASVQLSQRNPPVFVQFRGDNELYGFWHIDDDSWLHDLVSGRERWIVLQYQLVNPEHKTLTRTNPDLNVTARFPHPTWSKRPPSAAQVEKMFVQNEESDASEPFADAELPLGAIATPNAADASRLPKRCRAHG